MFGDQFEKLGELLLKSSLITENQLSHALQEQKNVKKKIGELLLDLGAVSEEDLTKVLSEQINIPCADRKALESIDSTLTAIIPEPFAVEHDVLPLRRDGDTLEVAMADPENIAIVDSLTKLAGCTISPLLAGKTGLRAAIARNYESLRDSGAVDTVMSDLQYEIREEQSVDQVDLTAGELSAGDAPIVKFVNIVLSSAIRDRATDIHIEPRAESLVVRYRIDGALITAMTAPINSLAGVVSRIKVMAKLNIAESRLPQDGRFSVRLTDRAVDVRVSILPTVTGEKIVLRLLDKGLFNLDLSSLGFDKHDLHIFRRCINHPYGIIIISGPTGSGKSTSLYAALNDIKSEEDNIVTVEDPVEYQMDGIAQVATNDKIDLTFAATLRSVLRQDPDKVLIGEIRDQETADIAMKFALTGHLVFTTLHANDSVSTITRLIDIGTAPFLVGSSVILVMAQRLIRVICEECKEPYAPTPMEIELLGLNEDESSRTFYHGVGCSHCKNTGYYGRTGIFELMPVQTDLRKMIMSGKDQEALRAQALQNEMRTLRRSALNRLFDGVTSVKEVLKQTVEEF